MPLIVTVPGPCIARLRFSTTNQLESELIRLDTGGPWSHVESIEDNSPPDGPHIVAAQTSFVEGTPDPGVRRFPLNYDFWSIKQCFVDIPMSKEQYEAWIGFLWDQCGLPFDNIAFLGFAIPILNMHQRGAWICSALQTAALRKSGFPAPIEEATYHESPNALFAFLQTLGNRVLIHPIECDVV